MPQNMLWVVGITNWGCCDYKLRSVHATKHVMGGWAYKLRSGDYKLRRVHATKHVMGCGDYKLRTGSLPPPQKKTE